MKMITQKRNRKIAALALGAVALGALTNMALAGQTLTARYEQTMPLSKTEWDADIQLPQFSNPFAELVSARLGVDAGAVMSLKIENYRNRTAADVETFLGTRVMVYGPDALAVGLGEVPIVTGPLQFTEAEAPVTGNALLFEVLAQIHRVDSFSAWDGTWDYDGPSGLTLLGLTASDSRSALYTDPEQLAVFAGEGMLGFHVNASAARVMNGPGNTRVKTTVLAESTVWVEYEYQPYQEECGGGTRGFWRNRHGLALITDYDLYEILNQYLNLRDGAGKLVEFDTKADFARWLRRCNARNMASQLSAQLAAFSLNVLHGKWGLDEIVPGSEACFSPDGVTAYELIVLANESLAANGLTPPGHPDRAYQECLKNALDLANNLAEERECERDGGDCAPCDGKVTQLTLSYAGDPADQITVVGGKKKAPVTFFDGCAAADGTFTVTGDANGGTLGTEIVLYVNGELAATIHTSCSKPIGPGLVAGPFTVLEGYSLNGGLLCPVENQEDGCGACDRDGCHHQGCKDRCHQGCKDRCGKDGKGCSWDPCGKDGKDRCDKGGKRHCDQDGKGGCDKGCEWEGCGEIGKGCSWDPCGKEGKDRCHQGDKDKKGKRHCDLDGKDCRDKGCAWEGFGEIGEGCSWDPCGKAGKDRCHQGDKDRCDKDREDKDCFSSVLNDGHWWDRGGKSKKNGCEKQGKDDQKCKPDKKKQKSKKSWWCWW